MKNIQLIFIILFLCGISYAQTNKPAFTLDDGCGDPMVESQTYGYRRGKVIRVINSNKLIVEITHSNNVWDDEHEEYGDESKLVKPQIFEVSLVGIDDTINKKVVTEFLKQNLHNKQVTIIGNTRKKNLNKIKALVRFTKDDEFEEISEYLLENGIAKFKDFQLTNLVPMLTHCELERAEANAKKAKLGIWAK